MEKNLIEWNIIVIFAAQKIISSSFNTNMKKQFMILASSGMILAGCQSDIEISEWTISTRDAYFQSNPIEILPSASADARTIVINPQETAQTLKGFGTCFNELGWASLKVLNEEELQTIFSELFEPGKGANLNRGRMSMGANDFSIDYYSPAETPGDFELRDFSIERDKQNIIPMAKWAMQYCPDFYWFVSPWCPPRWMKKTGHYAERAVTPEMAEMIAQYMTISKTEGILDDGPLAFRSIPTANDAVPGEEGKEGVTGFIMEPEYLDAYARLFGKFVDAYRAEGVNIQMAMPQNEHNSDQGFPSCCWTAADLNTFVGKYLGPEMEKHNVEVYFGTEERPNPMLVDTLLQDAESSRYIKGVAFQWAGKDALPTIHQNYPELDYVMSEQECGNGLNNWEGAMHSWDLQRHYLSHGVTQYYYWNTSLYQDKPSRWGWHQNSLITVNEEDHSWTYTPEYYELKHLSHYALPGAKRLLLNGSTYEDMLGFVNPDGSVALIVANQTEEPSEVSIQLNGQTLAVALQPNSLNTLVLK